MNHNEFKQMIQLSLYGELSDDKQKLLIAHLESCKECRTELEHQKKIMMLIADHKNLEVNEDLLKDIGSQFGVGWRDSAGNTLGFNNRVFNNQPGKLGVTWFTHIASG